MARNEPEKIIKWPKIGQNQRKIFLLRNNYDVKWLNWTVNQSHDSHHVIRCNISSSIIWPVFEKSNFKVNHQEELFITDNPLNWMSKVNHLSLITSFYSIVFSFFFNLKFFKFSGSTIFFKKFWGVLLKGAINSLKSIPHHKMASKSITWSAWNFLLLNSAIMAKTAIFGKMTISKS